MTQGQLDQVGPGSLLPYVSGRLIEIVRYIIYNRVMAFDSCHNFVMFYLDIKMLTSIHILIFLRKYTMLGQA